MLIDDFDWVDIPAGTFSMGSNLEVDKVAANLEWARKFETPQHQVDLPAYRISKFPVTNAQWEFFLNQSHYIWKDKDKLWAAGLPKSLENHPIVWVTWHDALAFCQWAKVRLPTEAEWEKAACGTNNSLYPWGNKAPTAQLANYHKQVGSTTSVDYYPQGQSGYGVFDMAGNTWEWMSTVWGSERDNPEFVYPYKQDDGRECIDNPDILRVVRSGGWKYTEDMIRCAYRDWNEPQMRGSALGFRVVAIEQ